MDVQAPIQTKCQLHVYATSYASGLRILTITDPAHGLTEVFPPISVYARLEESSYWISNYIFSNFLHALRNRHKN